MAAGHEWTRSNLLLSELPSLVTWSVKAAETLRVRMSRLDAAHEM